MRITLLLITAALFGCRSSNDGLYWGRHCTPASESQAWECDQRLMRDGRPVDEKSFSADEIPPNPQRAALDKDEQKILAENTVSKETMVIDTGSVNPGMDIINEAVKKSEVSEKRATKWTALADSDWKKNLPNLDGTLPQAESKKKRKPIIRASRIAPVAEQILLPDFESKLPVKADDTGQVAIPVEHKTDGVTQRKMEAKNRVANTAPVTKNPISTNQSGFTLQLAAFTELSDREDFIVGHGLEDFPVKHRYVQGKGKNWYVLLFGSYPSFGAAQAAAEQLLVEKPTLSYWVRALDSMVEVAQQNEQVLTADNTGK